jgi:hypothetical protein
MPGLAARLLCLFLLDATAPGATLGQQAPTPAPPTLSEAERLYGLSLFWKEADYSFPYFDQLGGLDWDSAYTAFVPQVLRASSACEYYRALQRFAALLQDGHTSVTMPEAVLASCGFDVPWVTLREVRRRAIVANVGETLANRIPIGSEVLAVDAVPVEDFLRAKVFPYIAHGTEHVRWDWGIRGNRYAPYGLLLGPAGSPARLRIRTPGGEVREVEVVRDRAVRTDAWARPIPAGGNVLEHREIEPGIDYVALNGFGNRRIVAEFEALLPALRESCGVILDLRGNSGGSLTTGKLILRHFVTDTLLGFVWQTREHRAAFKAWGRWAAEDPWARQYEDYARGTAWHAGAPDTLFPAPGPRIEAPLVILTGHGTASAGEDLLVFLDGTRRATLVGEPTNGSSGEPLFFDLPGGGSARIVSYRETYPDGRRTLIDQGVQPDVLVELTMEDIRAGRDPVLETGIEVLRKSLRCAAGKGTGGRH